MLPDPTPVNVHPKHFTTGEQLTETQEVPFLEDYHILPENPHVLVTEAPVMTHKSRKHQKKMRQLLKNCVEPKNGKKNLKKKCYEGNIKFCKQCLPNAISNLCKNKAASFCLNCKFYE